MKLLAIPWHAIIKVMELAVTLVTTIINAKQQNAKQQNAKKEKEYGKDSNRDSAEQSY